jgi:NifU-like protein involved in Fe-S cluster formation
MSPVAHDTAAPRAEAHTVGDLLSDPSHGGSLDGASRVGEAALGDRRVRVGLWLDGPRVVQARFMATTCASLVAYAEAACRALESGARAPSAGALRSRVRGVHPGHLDRAEAVATAVQRALGARPEEPR